RVVQPGEGEEVEVIDQLRLLDRGEERLLRLVELALLERGAAQVVQDMRTAPRVAGTLEGGERIAEPVLGGRVVALHPAHRGQVLQRDAPDPLIRTLVQDPAIK